MEELIYLTDEVDAVVERLLTDEELCNCGLGKRKVLRTLKSFGGDEIACSVFLKKYALRDEEDQIIEFTLDEAKDRWASFITSAEEMFVGENVKKAPVPYFRELYEYFLPAGRQMYALGNNFVSKATFANCYVDGIEEDSIEGIFEAAKRMAKTYSYGGGVGLCIGPLRPDKSKVSNSAQFSTGAISFTELYSMVTGIIGQRSRRGALLLSIPVSHPDVEKFVEIKNKDSNAVRFANLSVKLTDEFMNAVEKDEDFTLSFTTPHETISKTIKARDLWKKLVKSAHNSAEPGLLFWSQAQKMSPSNTYSELQISTTNPCGEIFLEKNGVCCLGSLLLHNFVINPFTEEAYFDFDKFKEMIPRAVRHLDNVIELNYGRHALKAQNETTMLGRRIGLGFTGLADMLAALNIKYDSQEAIDFVDKMLVIKRDTEYAASVRLAKERGSFKLFDSSKHFERGFCATLPEEIKQAGREHGLRNVALSTVAPSGSVSIIAQCSSGLEPIFALSYKRYVELGEKRKEFTIFHPGLKRYFHITNEQEISDVWVAAHQIDYDFRIQLQSIIQKYTDNSISSTINLPKDVLEETVSKIYVDAWKSGLKGITVYREGSREGILVTNTIAKEMGVPVLDTAVHCIRAEGGDKFYVMISYEDGDISKPYQVFVLNYKQAEKDAFIKISNAFVKMLKTEGVSEDRIQKYLDRSNNSLVKLTRFLSLSLKTNNLDKAILILDNNAFAGTLASKLCDILRKSVSLTAVCQNCKGSNVKMEEGCILCLDCGWSGCS